MYQLSPVWRVDRRRVDTTVRYGVVGDAVNVANAHRRAGVPVRVRAVTGQGAPGEFVGGDALAPLGRAR